MSLPSVSRRAIAGVVVAGVVVVAGFLLSPSAATGIIESISNDPSLFALAVAGLYLIRPAFAWPTTPLAMVVGYGYGVALGVPVALVGVVVTVLPVFLAVRWLTTDDGRGTACDDDILERAGNVVARYYETTGPLRGVTASRLAPIPSDVSTAAAAISGVRLRHFVTGTVLGEVPWTVAAVVVGASASTATTGGLGEVGLALSVACALGAVVLLAQPTYRLLQRRRRNHQSQSSSRPPGG
ncbi:TVP38/TMEM64 family protein [Natronobacterium gregoryi]|uniref:TVP38/TMEM64 family protein n=2 Tax=Natronobacterium gregoryi TaxID=44930 RepID=L0AM48_NATGS|nr:VTT domain-containing protein [Natronobacterium gregoryi]AFZ74871.1 hypothetical protein Natgr_3769 [Natronobacterium gregoryi SP2]ELY73289.1 hypothetical protein C490_01742 [Natronobacterium gregoryi SP2]PLK19324.1 TVP38/TMEM64 family protein [Natronobacterium gregoryi SP2]SFJ53622.1 Uncharacterized membrane protein YdjX, TVP38/TMEM64 family, SNARE-associated domain [Natronobacterium gregoryi]